MNSSIISIHQPSYFPWLGYIHKVFASNHFVVHDNVEFSKNSMYRRTFIRKNEFSKEYIIIPLQKHSDFELIKDLKICNNTNWQIKHINKLKNNYSDSKYFNKYQFDICEMLLQSKKIDNFSDFIIVLLRDLLSLLNIKTNLYRSSMIPVSGYKTDYNIKLIQYFNSTTYLSGAGAFKYYQKIEDFHAHGITVVKQEIFEFLQQHNYPQQYSYFMNGLSAIDAVFNIGIDGITRILEIYSEIMFRNTMLDKY